MYIYIYYVLNLSYTTSVIMLITNTPKNVQVIWGFHPKEGKCGNSDWRDGTGACDVATGPGAPSLGPVGSSWCRMVDPY